MKSLHYFNPENDMAVGEGTHYYQPPAHICSFKNELALLPIYLADNQDVVLIPDKIDYDFILERLQLIGISANLITPAQIKLPDYDILSPWGWSKLTHQQLRDYKPGCSEAFLSHPISEWDEALRDLYGKETVIHFLPELLTHLEPYNTDFIPRRIETIEQLQRLAVDYPLVVKTPWSGAGKGVRFLIDPHFDEFERNWIKGMLRRNGFLTAARRVEKVLDFSMQFHIDFEGNVSYIGLSPFSTSENGFYKGNMVASQHNIEQYITSQVSEVELEKVKQALLSTLPTFVNNQYYGYFGVDMMVFVDTSGSHRIHPFVELNLRKNMGILAINIYNKLIYPDSYGELLFAHSTKFGLLLKHHTRQITENPLQICQGKIAAGYYPLTPVYESSTHVAYIVVDSTRTIVR